MTPSWAGVAADQYALTTTIEDFDVNLLR